MNSSAQRPPTPPPLPPPLASHRAQGDAGERPSTYLASLEAAGPPFMDTAVHVPIPDESIKPVWYFFYGTLAKPEILKHILDLQEEPLLRPAKIIGYKLAAWGQYRALVDGEPSTEVSGFAYEVQTTEHEFKLVRYETNAYKLHSCQIIFTDDKEPRELSGNTFMYAGDAAALQDGRFDRVLWELQMGTRMPEKWKTSTEDNMKRTCVGLDNGAHSSSAEAPNDPGKYN